MITIIYLIGVILSLIISMCILTRGKGFITIGDLIFIIFITALSWLGVIAGIIALCLCFINFDKVIWRRKI